MPRIDWVSFCSAYNVKTKGIRKKTWLQVKCPFCHNDNGYHGAIALNSGAYSCWKCGTHSKDEFIAKVSGASPERAWEILRPFASGNTSYSASQRKEEPMHAEHVVLPSISRLSQPMKDYLARRGFNPEYMERKYGLKDGGIAGDWAFRLLIPIYQDGRLIAWQGRHIGNSDIRYKASDDEQSAVNIKEAVYNMDNCKRDTVIAVEGVVDCWKIGDDCIAFFGIEVKDTQLKKIAERFKAVYFLFDPEPLAQARAEEYARKLAMLGIAAWVVSFSDTDSEDAGDMSKDEVLAIKRTVFKGCPDYDYALEQFKKE